MKITVFTSSYNYAKHLRQSIESVLSQTYQDFEYHLIDYGSTDNTWEIISEYKDDRIKAMQIGSQPNGSFVMNHSIRLAQGKYWSWCPADDYWHSTLLEKKVEYAKKYPEAVLYNDFFTIDDNGNSLGEVTLPIMTQEYIREKIWEHGLIGFTGIFIPVYIFEDLNLYFPEDEFISEDYWWMIMATTMGLEFVGVPEKLHYKRKHAQSMTQSRFNEMIANMKVIHKKIRGY